MRDLKIIIYVVLLTLASSCVFDNKHKNVDSFYTTRNYGQFPVIPLIKPIKLLQDDQSLEWNIEYNKDSFKQRISTYNLKQIGVSNQYIHGRLDKKKQTVNSYKKGCYLFLNKYNTFHMPPKPRQAEKDEIRVYPIDSTSKTFILPERWFVINVSDSKTEAFFSREKYQDYLKRRGISSKMYDVNKYHKKFKETGILPWFPDSIKIKLKK